MTVARLRGIPPTIFAEMSALATATGAINLGQGFPDVDGPAAVIERAVVAMREGANQYAPGIGVPALREAIARHQQRHYGLEVDPATQVVVTTGATEAIAGAILGLVEPGDEVVLLEPYYDSYPAMIQMAGGVRRPVTLRAPDFRLDVAALRSAVTDRTRLILLNTPHNPTGTVLTRDELDAVAQVAVERDLVVVTDEVYEHLTFGEAGHVPLASFPGMADRTLTLSSIGKSYSFTGWKIGWASGPAHLVQAVLDAKQWLTYTSGAPLQVAAAWALDEASTWPLELAASLRERRDLLCDGLRSVGFDVTVPQGTYFATTDITALGWADGDAFCRALPERTGVVAIPTQGFYEPTRAPHDHPGRQLVRWAFCKRPEVLEQAVARLGAADLTGPLG